MADNVIGWLQKGDVVAHVATSTDRMWLKIRRGDLEGWASQKHLTLVQPKEQKFRVAGAAELNVRKTPKIEPGNIVGTLKQGDAVTVSATSSDGRFLKVAKGTLRGWSSKRFLTLVHSAAHANGDPAWLRIAVAERGVKEKPGAADNPRIVEYLKSTNLGSPQNKNDETAWCSAFVNWCVEQAGFDGTDSALARHWLKWARRSQRRRRVASPCSGGSGRAGQSGMSGSTWERHRTRSAFWAAIKTTESI